MANLSESHKLQASIVLILLLPHQSQVVVDYYVGSVLLPAVPTLAVPIALPLLLRHAQMVLRLCCCGGGALLGAIGARGSSIHLGSQTLLTCMRVSDLAFLRLKVLRASFPCDLKSKEGGLEVVNSGR